MWEKPEELWRRLNLGREEYLQRLTTTLIVGGEPPPWNTPRTPSEQGRYFLRLLDEVAHEHAPDPTTGSQPAVFVDEYFLPKLEEAAQNGWPDWAVLWQDRTWIIELKTEASSHRADQLPYYLRLTAAAHPDSSVDLTYITGPLSNPAPELVSGQRFSHLTWEQVLPMVQAAWGPDPRHEVVAYVEMVRTVIENLSVLRPAEQRRLVLGPPAALPPTSSEPQVVSGPAVPNARIGGAGERPGPTISTPSDLVDIARSTATDGRQRGLGVSDPIELETIRDTALAEIGTLSADDATRYVRPWLWQAGRTDGKALTPEGEEFGYELRFSRYKEVQVKP